MMSLDGSLTAALRQVLNQLARLLEEQDAAPLLRPGGPLHAALGQWRAVLGERQAQPAVQREAELEQAKLELMGRVAVLQKEHADLRGRNQELLEQIVRLNQREETVRKQSLEAQLAVESRRAEAKRLDLEVRDLRRRIRELEGGPALSPAEAAPRSTLEAEADPVAQLAPPRRRRRSPKVKVAAGAKPSAKPKAKPSATSKPRGRQSRSEQPSGRRGKR
jgi:predicted RNase H-like nuclease (RuvC/YqgF family)